MGPTALLPLRRKACWGFFRPKNPTASAGFEPANLGTKGQHATPRPPKPLMTDIWGRNIAWGGGLLRGFAISLTEFRGHLWRFLRITRSTRDRAAEREVGRKGGRCTMLRSIAIHRYWLLLVVWDEMYCPNCAVTGSGQETWNGTVVQLSVWGELY